MTNLINAITTSSQSQKIVMCNMAHYNAKNNYSLMLMVIMLITHLKNYLAHQCRYNKRDNTYFDINNKIDNENNVHNDNNDEINAHFCWKYIISFMQ